MVEGVPPSMVEGEPPSIVEGVPPSIVEGVPPSIARQSRGAVRTWLNPKSYTLTKNPQPKPQGSRVARRMPPQASFSK